MKRIKKFKQVQLNNEKPSPGFLWRRFFLVEMKGFTRLVVKITRLDAKITSLSSEITRLAENFIQDKLFFST
jgi:hypothetical protein